MAEAFVPAEIPESTPDTVPEGVELLKTTYPFRLMKEAGEKAFIMDEELALPDSVPQPEQIVYYRSDPRVTDRKVLSEKECRPAPALPQRGRTAAQLGF